MTFFIFSAGADGWAGTGFTWVSDDGSPDAGCMHRHDDATFVTALCSITGLSINVSSGFHVECRVKYTGTLSNIGGGAIRLSAKDGSGNELGGCVFYASSAFTIPDTWLGVEGGNNFTPTATPIVTLEIQLVGSGNSVTDLWFDYIYVGEFPPAGPDALAEKRYLGMTADNEYIYLTSVLSGGTLALQYHELSNLIPLAGYDTFGSAAYTDPDTFTRGIYPVLRPGADKVIYLRGRDGNDKQVQFNDLNGTLGWIDVGGTWDTTKFAVALMPWPATPRGVIVAFSDGEIYETFYGTTDWTVGGSATTQLKTAIRSDVESYKLLLGGTIVDGTVLYTQNKGISFGSGGTVAGTINAIEWSYPNA